MRIAVLGAGAVGGTLAALLSRAGHQVTVTARGDNLAALQAEGLQLDGGWGSVHASVTAVPALSEPPELAILATKAQDAAGALRENLAVLQGVPLVVVQNGLGGLRVAGELLPGSPLYGGLALMASSYVSPAHVTVTGPNPLILGAAPGTTLDPAVVRTLESALPVEVTRDIEEAQWTKLLINHVNALPAITGLSVQDVVADASLRRVMTASMRETVRLARRMGVRFATVQGVSGSVLGLIGAAPLRVGEVFPRLLSRRLGDVPNPGSTLQSLRRGRPTEIDFLNGAVVAAAAEHGLPAPINAAIVDLVHEVERTGVFLTPDQVVERVPLSMNP